MAGLDPKADTLALLTNTPATAAKKSPAREPAAPRVNADDEAVPAADAEESDA